MKIGRIALRSIAACSTWTESIRCEALTGVWRLHWIVNIVLL